MSENMGQIKYDLYTAAIEAVHKEAVSMINGADMSKVDTTAVMEAYADIKSELMLEIDAVLREGD